jgi:hypothetical protein
VLASARMSVLVVSLLAAAAGWLVVPVVIRRHRQASVTASVAEFEQHIQLLATRLGPTSPPSSPTSRLQPRRVIVARWLAAVTAVVLVPAWLLGGGWWAVPLLGATLYGTHQALVRRACSRTALRAKVHHLPVRPQPQQPAPVLVRAQ